MDTEAAEAQSETDSRHHHPRRLVLSLIGELRRSGHEGPFRAVTLINVLEGAGVSAPAARAALDRFAVRGFLAREREGRGVTYRVTGAAEQVLDDAAARVHAEQPFEPNGDGWTLVTFSIPEDKRGVRHRLRSALTWAGFAALRDGLWVAPGRLDPEQALGSLRTELAEADLVAFHAQDLTCFPMAERVPVAWDLDAIRAEHEWFLGQWDRPAPEVLDASPLSALTMLVADWLVLLRRDPGLPAEYLGEDWPAARSFEAYRRRRGDLAERAAAEAAAWLAPVRAAS